MGHRESACVAIVGGGAAGLILAIELGRRGVQAILLEDDPGPPAFPKANASTSRTMEHYRRLGFAHEIRMLGLPDDYPQDVTYYTRYSTHELARLPGRTRREALLAREGAESRWPTPEPLHRTQQTYIEAVLRRHAATWRSIDARFGWRATRIERRGEGVSIQAEEVASGRTQAIRCAYLVGCDGPRSIVRRTLGIEYTGWSGEERDFMGGQMLALHFRSAALYSVVNGNLSWQYWAVNRERRGLVCSIDGKELFVYHTQLPRSEQPSEDYARKSLMLSTGREFPIQPIGTAAWTAGYTLVAEHFADRLNDPRVFIAGDAAHLFTPTGGQGYNTAVDDAVNLGWKLAAACKSSGGSNLLASYEAERKPVAHRNTGFARAMADSIGRIPLPGNLEEDTPDGQRSRAEIGARLLEHSRREFDIPGIHFGVWYGGSPLVSEDGSAPPGDDWHRYTPSATPGARAPHLWVGEDESIFDRFGMDFTLLRLGHGVRADALPFAAAARTRGVNLAVLDVAGAEARDLYARDLVLIRPDQHVAWRGNAVPDDPQAVIDRALGFGG